MQLTILYNNDILYDLCIIRASSGCFVIADNRESQG